ncbi:unnamed protein product, partial [Prorocentrum cordatum]
VPMALYGAVPLVTAVHRWADGAAASGFFFCNPSEGFVKVDGPDSGFFGGSPDTRSWWVFESGIIDTFLFAGPTAAAVMQQYHTVTGWGRLPPFSTLGKHQSRWNYVDVDDSIGVNKKFDQHDIPYDVLWLDIEHTDGKKYFTWHPTHFAKPDELLGALEQSKRKLVTIVDPHIKRESGYDVFETIKKMDLFTKTSAGVQYDGWCWPGTSFYPDFCNPAMRDQWAKFFAMDYYPHNSSDCSSTKAIFGAYTDEYTVSEGSLDGPSPLKQDKSRTSLEVLSMADDGFKSADGWAQWHINEAEFAVDNSGSTFIKNYKDFDGVLSDNREAFLKAERAQEQRLALWRTATDSVISIVGGEQVNINGSKYVGSVESNSDQVLEGDEGSTKSSLVLRRGMNGEESRGEDIEDEESTQAGSIRCLEMVAEAGRQGWLLPVNEDQGGKNGKVAVREDEFS